MESYRAIILVAVVGKFLGSAGRKICWTELERQLEIALMNTRVNGVDCVKHRIRAQGSDS
jgi:hypothetical protein